MGSLEYIVFDVGGEAYGLEAHDIKEVLRVKEIRLNKVPKTLPYIKGLVNLRGEILPVMHLEERFDYAKRRRVTGIRTLADLEAHRLKSAKGTPKRLIVVGIQHYAIGILVDAIIGHMTIEEAEFLLPTDQMTQETPYIKGLVVTEGQAFFVLNAEKLEQREWEDA